MPGRWLSVRSYKDWSSRHDPSATLVRGRYCTPELLAPTFRILSSPSSPLPYNPERSPSCCNGDLSLIASRETSTKKAKLPRKKLCWTKATKERVGQHLRTQLFMLLAPLAARLACRVLRAASILKFKNPLSN